MDSKYWKFVGIGAAHMFAGRIVLPILAPYFSQLGYSDQWISFVFGLFPFVMVFAGLLIGELSDEVGRSWTIRVAFLLTILSYFMYYSGWEAAIIAARVIDAIAYSALSILLLAKVEDQLDDDSRGKYTGLLLTFRTGAKMFAPLLGGWLADQFLGLPFLASIIIYVLLAFSLRNKHFHTKTDHVTVHPLKNVAWFFRNAQLRPMAVLGPFMHFLHAAIVVFVPLLVVKQLGLSYSMVGLAMMMVSAGHLMQYFAGDLADRYGRRKFIVGGTFFMALAVFLLAIVPLSLEAVLILLGFYGLAASFWNTGAWAHMSDAAEKEDKEGTMVGTYTAIAKAGQVVSFLVSGLIVAAWGYTGVFMLLGGVAIVGVLIAAHLFYHSWHLERVEG